VFERTREIFEDIRRRGRSHEVPCVTELGPELMFQSGIIELTQPGEFDVSDLYGTIHMYQPEGYYDVPGTVYEYLDGEDPRYRAELDYFVGLGESVFSGAIEQIDAVDYYDRSPNGEALGDRLHIDHDCYAMIYPQFAGSLVLIDKDNPGRLLMQELDIPPEERAQYAYQLRPGVWNMIHRYLWHMRPTEGQIVRGRSKGSRGVLGLRFTPGEWPDQLPDLIELKKSLDV